MGVWVFVTTISLSESSNDYQRGWLSIWSNWLLFRGLRGGCIVLMLTVSCCLPLVHRLNVVWCWWKQPTVTFLADDGHGELVGICCLFVFNQRQSSLRSGMQALITATSWSYYYYLARSSTNGDSWLGEYYSFDFIFVGGATDGPFATDHPGA